MAEQAEIRLKKGIFGYRKKRVNAYLAQLSQQYASAMGDKDKTIADLNNKLGALTRKINEYEAERLNVANTLVKAEKEAEQAIANASKDALAEKERLMAELEVYRKKIDDAKQTLSKLRGDTLDLMQRYREYVDQIAGQEDVQVEQAK